MEGRQPSSRSLLAIIWTAFVLMWAMAALIAVSLTQVIACGDGGGSPYAAPGSPAGRIATPSTTTSAPARPEADAAFVYGWPLLVLGAVGVYGVWKCCKRLMVAVRPLASVRRSWL